MARKDRDGACVKLITARGFVVGLRSDFPISAYIMLTVSLRPSERQHLAREFWLMTVC